MKTFMKKIRARRERKERGAALVEFAVAVPILIALLAIVFDVGIGYTDARTSSSAARSAARIGALAGDTRTADFRVLDALRAQFGSGETVRNIYVYMVDPSTNPDGLPPAEADCDETTKCTRYPGSVLATLTKAAFEGEDNSGATTTCAGSSPDRNWCPLDRRADDGKFLGVYIETTSRKTIGAISPDAFELEDRAVFALYFPPAAAPTATPTAN